MRLLAVGTSVRHIAQSASRFSDVVAVDEFCDLDTERHAERCLRLDEVNEASVKEAVRSIDFDHVVTTTPRIPPEMPVLGNPVEDMRRAGDKLLFARYCEGNGIPHPATSTEPSEETPLEKPRLGGGGVKNRLSRTRRPGRIYQEVVEGDDLSVCLISDGNSAETVAVNGNFSGLEVCGPPSPYAYCGNLTPLDHPLANLASSLAERIVEDLGLVGSVGVDFIAGQEAVPLEVNPRIQASLDTVEESSGMSVTRLHVDACMGNSAWRKSLKDVSFQRYACRLVAYAPRDLEAPVLSGPGLRDLPVPGRRIGRGEPVASVLSTASGAEEAFTGAVEAVRNVRRKLGGT